MISQTAEYALRAVVFLAEQRDQSFTIQKIATTTKVPAGYLAKVMQQLARAGIVESQRGLGGGFRLTVLPEELTLFAVIDAVDPLPRITTCPLKLDAHRYSLCALHRRLDEAMETIERLFKDSTIADLLTKPIFLEIRCGEKSEQKESNESG